MLTVRNASTVDSAVIAHLGRTTFAETFGELFTEHPHDLASYLDTTFAQAKIAASIVKPGNHFWVAHRDGVPIGYAKLKLDSSHPAIGGKSPAQLQKIYVLRDHLSVGAGKELHQAILDCAREGRKQTLWLMALESNQRASDFYRRHDWQLAAKDAYSIGAQEFTYDVLSLTL